MVQRVTSPSAFPNYNAPIAELQQGLVTYAWRAFFSVVWRRVGGGGGLPPQELTLSGTDGAFVASVPGTLVLSSGTFTGLTFKRGTASVVLDPASPVVPLSQGDEIDFTFSSIPVVMFIPT